MNHSNPSTDEAKLTAKWHQYTHRNVWQHPLWGKLQQNAGRKVFFLSPGKTYALVVKHALPLGFCYLNIGRGPLFEAESDLPPLMEELQTLAQKEKAIFIRMSPPLPLGPSLPGLKASQNDHHPPTSLFLDLSQSEEELLKQMKTQGRYNVRLAQKKELSVKDTNNVEDFHQLLEKTSDRNRFGIHSKDYLEVMLKSLEDQVQILVAYHQDQPIAGGVFVYLEDWAIYYYGASDHAYRQLMGPYLIQWIAIREAKKRGCRFYDFLGIAPEGAKNHPWAGVTEFKKKFGGWVVNYPPAVELTIRPFWHWVYRLRGRFKK